MRKEQERQDDNQRFLETVLLWLKRMPRDSESGRFKTATGLFDRAKLVLKKEREWIVRKEIHDIQEKVCELKRQLNDDEDEDLNDFEVQHNNICNVATVHDKDKNKVLTKLKQAERKVQHLQQDAEERSRRQRELRVKLAYCMEIQMTQKKVLDAR